MGEGRRRTGLVANLGSVAEDPCDALVEVERAGVVEEHLTAVGEDFFDHLVDRIVQGRGATTGVGQEAIAVRGDVGRMLEVGLDQERLAALSKAARHT